MKKVVVHNLIDKLAIDATKASGYTDPILSDPVLLARAAEIYRSNEDILTYVLMGRMDSIARRMVHDARPEELIAFRTALYEIGFVLDDFAAYSTEYAEHEAAAKAKSETGEKTLDGQDNGET